MNIAELMYTNARKHPDKEAIVFKQKRLSYRGMDEFSNQFAHVLVKLGIKKGDRIAMMMRNSERFVAVYFGILKAGAVVVPINISLVRSEVEFIVNNCEAKIVVFDEIFVPVVKNIRQEVRYISYLICVGDNNPEQTLHYDKLVSKESVAPPPVIIEDDDLCSIIYTSGTTGTPRGAFSNTKMWLI